MSRLVLTLVALASVSAASLAPAALIVTSETNGTSETFYPVSAVDLINQGQPTLGAVTATNYNNFGTFSHGGLNDGTLGAPSAGSSANTFDLDGAWTSEYGLNLLAGANSIGYRITSIQTVAGWISPRTNQEYSIEYSEINNALFTSLGSFTLSPAFTSTGSSRITITDTSGTIADNVDAIRFLFVDPATGDATVYREIDVFGVEELLPPVVPEPATWTLLGLGAVGLFVARRRK